MGWGGGGAGARGGGTTFGAYLKSGGGAASSAQSDSCRIYSVRSRIGIYHGTSAAEAREPTAKAAAGCWGHVDGTDCAAPSCIQSGPGECPATQLRCSGLVRFLCWGRGWRRKRWRRRRRRRRRRRPEMARALESLRRGRGRLRERRRRGCVVFHGRRCRPRQLPVLRWFGDVVRLPPLLPFGVHRTSRRGQHSK
jgi:hypothetical protein